jgi:hypothetical protein
MKLLILVSLIALPFSFATARDPGTGSNTTVGPGPAGPDSGSRDTSIMGGGTPGGLGINNYGLEGATDKQLKEIKQKQEERKQKKNEEDLKTGGE